MQETDIIKLAKKRNWEAVETAINNKYLCGFSASIKKRVITLLTRNKKTFSGADLDNYKKFTDEKRFRSTNKKEKNNGNKTI